MSIYNVQEFQREISQQFLMLTPELGNGEALLIPSEMVETLFMKTISIGDLSLNYSLGLTTTNGHPQDEALESNPSTHGLTLPSHIDMIRAKPEKPLAPYSIQQSRNGKRERHSSNSNS